jgi:hypothetical protein
MPMNIRKEANDRILVRNDGAGDGFHTAASTQAHKWMTPPPHPFGQTRPIFCFKIESHTKGGGPNGVVVHMSKVTV